MFGIITKEKLVVGTLFLLIVITIPLTVLLSQQNQDNRQEAAIKKIEETLPPLDERVSGQLIVKYNKDVEDDKLSSDTLADEVNLSVEKKLDKLQTEVVTVTRGEEAKTILELESDPDVDFVEPDIIFEADFLPNDPEWSKQYSLPKISAPTAWDTTKGSGVRIAVLDSGIDLDHPDLAKNIVLSQNFSTAPTASDVQGHGSHVAGIIAAVTNNETGTAGGCPECKLINAKVLGDNGQGSCSSIAEGIIWAVDNGAKVLNMSFGSSTSCQTYEDALIYAWNKGAILVATAGNSGDETPRYPAYYENVIAVASTDSNDTKAASSGYGSWVDFAAPGVSIYSTIPDNYGYKSGTSMAAPLVSAVAGLIWSTPQGTSHKAVRSILESSADPIIGTGTYWKYGRINAAKAIVASISPTPTIIASPPTTSGSTKLTFSVFLHGVGKSGDNVNSQSAGNITPTTTQRTLTVEIFNNNDQRILQKNTVLTYNNTSGSFTGNVELGTTFPSGTYTIKVKVPTFLKKSIAGIHTIQNGSTTSLPPVTLVAGDANDDNVLNILDYTLIIGCYSDLSPAKDCDTNRAEMTDLNDDKSNNQIDYNLFLREMSVQAGD